MEKVWCVLSGVPHLDRLLLLLGCCLPCHVVLALASPVTLQQCYILVVAKQMEWVLGEPELFFLPDLEL